MIDVLICIGAVIASLLSSLLERVQCRRTIQRMTRESARLR